LIDSISREVICIGDRYVDSERSQIFGGNIYDFASTTHIERLPDLIRFAARILPLEPEASLRELSDKSSPMLNGEHDDRHLHRSELILGLETRQASYKEKPGTVRRNNAARCCCNVHQVGIVGRWHTEVGSGHRDEWRIK